MKVCGYEDPLSGAKCTLEAGHGVYHEDLSTPGIEFRFKDSESLIVPKSGTIVVVSEDSHFP